MHLNNHWSLQKHLNCCESLEAMIGYCNNRSLSNKLNTRPQLLSYIHLHQCASEDGLWLAVVIFFCSTKFYSSESFSNLIFALKGKVPVSKKTISKLSGPVQSTCRSFFLGSMGQCFVYYVINVCVFWAQRVNVSCFLLIYSGFTQDYEIIYW